MWHLYTIAKVLKILLLGAGGLVFLGGQGVFVLLPVLFGASGKKRDVSLQQIVCLILLGGLVIDYGIVLLFQSIATSFVISCIVALLGMVFLAFIFLRRSSSIDRSVKSGGLWVFVIFISLSFLSLIVLQPLIDWDARSIWFFHAKMIYSAGSIGHSAGWADPSVAFSHPDYPILVPILAAQIGYVVRFWNEYLPKMALVLMLVPAIASLFLFARKSFGFLLLLIIFPFYLSSWIWNGYMDGYLALYFGLSMLFLGRYASSSRPIDIVSGLSCLGVSMYIKNEGMLALLTWAFAISFILWNKRKEIRKCITADILKYALISFFMFLPLILWTIYKHRWGLVNDLGVGTRESLTRIHRRLTDGSYKLILKSIYPQVQAAAPATCLSFLALLVQRRILPRECFPVLIASVLYGLGIFVVYLLTPADLSWHLGTSADRTMLPVSTGLFVVVYFIINKLETGGLDVKVISEARE